MSKNNDRGSKNQAKPKKVSTFEKVDKVVTTVKRGVDVAKGVVDFLKIITGRGGNDPSWYTHYPVDGLVGANYAIKRGVPIVRTPLASVARIDIDLVKPIGEGERAWNQGIAYLYATLRAANTSNVAYTLYDLEKYIFNVRAFRFAYAHLRRAYSICRTISPLDVSTPNIYMKAASVDTDYLNDLANVKQFGNMLSIKLARLAPIVGDLFNRTEWLLSYGYYDSDTDKAVPFIFASNSVKYMGLDENGDWESKTIPLNKFNTFRPRISEAIEEFINYPQFSLIAGDIIRTFGQESLTPLEVWDDNAEFPFVYNEEVLRQINNIKFSSFNDGRTYTLTVDPDTQFLKSSITYVNNDLYGFGTPGDIVDELNAYNENMLINAKYVNGPSAADILVDTRLIPVYFATKDDDERQILHSVTECGTEIADRVEIYYRNDDNTIRSIIATHTGIIDSMSIQEFSEVFNGISLWSQVDWMPQMTAYYVDVSDKEFRIGPAVWDIDKYAIITPRDVGIYHSYAVLSLLHADLKARVSNASELVIENKAKYKNK